MMHFLDTSALVKVYVREPGSDAMVELTEQAAPGELIVSSLAEVEFAAALGSLERQRKLNAQARHALLEQFRQGASWRFTHQPVGEPVLRVAVDLCERHPLRAYDAVQLASCLAQAAKGVRPRFVCSDRQLLKAAALEQLEVWNPETGTDG